MQLLEPTLIIAVASLVGLSIIASTLLRVWQGWLSLRQREMENAPRDPESGAGVAGGMGAARIEISDLKERIKKLEAIASGVDL